MAVITSCLVFLARSINHRGSKTEILVIKLIVEFMDYIAARNVAINMPEHWSHWSSWDKFPNLRVTFVHGMLDSTWEFIINKYSKNISGSHCTAVMLITETTQHYTQYHLPGTWYTLWATWLLICLRKANKILAQAVTKVKYSGRFCTASCYVFICTNTEHILVKDLAKRLGIKDILMWRENGYMLSYSLYWCACC